MDIKIRKDERFRVEGGGNNFIDVNGIGFESLCLDLYVSFQYIEVRRKDNQIRVYTFPKKSYKKSHDFGWWKDAEVIFAVNEQIVNK